MPGNADGRFHTTQWTLVLSAAADDPSHPALGTLCGLYWLPVYTFIRRQGHDASEAEDLTQSFFGRLVEKSYLAQADRARGRFRSFLLASVKHFLANERDRGLAQKRGGAIEHVSIDDSFDVLAGSLFGAAMVIVACLDRAIPPVEPLSASVRMLSSSLCVISHFFYLQTRAVFYALFAVVLLIALRSVVKPKWLGSTAWVLIATLVFMQTGVMPVHVAASAAIAGLLLAVIARFGTLAASTALFYYLLLLSTPVTMNFNRWYALRGALAMAPLLVSPLAAAAIASRRRAL